MADIKVKIWSSEETVRVKITRGREKIDEFLFETPGMLTGADLHEVLFACDVVADYKWKEPKQRKKTKEEKDRSLLLRTLGL